jgi:hypothetical protein
MLLSAKWESSVFNHESREVSPSIFQNEPLVNGGRK